MVAAITGDGSCYIYEKKNNFARILMSSWDDEPKLNKKYWFLRMDNYS